MPEVRMTLEEYLALLEAQGVVPSGARNRVSSQQLKKTAKIPVKRKGKSDPKMAKALRKANALGRTKAGKLRKGYTQAKIMKKAHQLRRKM